MNLFVPKVILDAIDEHRGCDSRQTFILKLVADALITGNNCKGTPNGKESCTKTE